MILDRWLSHLRPVRDPTFSLVLCHHAGATSTGYLQLAQYLPADWDVIAVDLPGRGVNFNSPSPADLAVLVEQLVPRLLAEIDTPFGLFGHSMGAVLAYDVAAAWNGPDRPVWLGVSGTGPPGTQRDLPADRAGAVELLRSLAGTPKEVLDTPFALDYAVELLMADLAALKSRRPGPPTGLPVPMTVFGGTADPAIAVEHLAGWQPYAAAGLRTRLWPGGHFYLFQQAISVAAAIGDEVARARRAATLGG